MCCKYVSWTNSLSLAVVVQLLSRYWLCDPMDCGIPGLPTLHHLLEFAQVQVHCISDAMQSSNPLTTSSPLVSVFFRIRDFSSESVLWIIRPKYWSFSISPSKEYLGLMIDWLDLLAIQVILKSCLQYHSSKASILWSSASLWSTSHNSMWPLRWP